jgi:hypothetical protein
MPRLPGDAHIFWQGIGQDRGLTLVQATINGHRDWYLVEKIQSKLTADIFDGREMWNDVEMASQNHFPYSWWTDPRWSAYPDSWAEPSEWTVVKSRISNIYPREWQYVYLKNEDQGTSELSDITTRWYGDAWFQNGTPRGTLKRYIGLSGVTQPSISLSYHWAGDVWKHHSEGSAPAGLYIRPEGGSDTKNVGFWDEETHQYTLNPNGEYLNKVLAPMNMFSFGIVRQPLVDPTDPMAQIIPTSWDFEGANWEEPDPFDWRYWHCVRAAILERESVVGCGVDREMGLLDSDEQFLWNISPYDPIDFNTIDTMRRCIIALSKEFVDLSSVVKQLRDDGLPYKETTCIDITQYENLMGGWSRGDPVLADSLGNLSGFLHDAKLALEKMTLAIPSRVYYHKVGPGTVCAGYADGEDGESIADAWREAMREYGDYEVEWEHWTKSRAEALSPVWWAVTSSIGGRCGDEVDNHSNHSYIAVFNWWSETLQSVCYPSSSVIDGLPWPTAPTVVYVRDAKKPDIEVGDSYYNGIVTRVSFYSGMGVPEGIRTGQLQFPLESIENPPGGAPMPGTAQEPYVTGWHVWGNSTTWWFYVYFGASFRFGGPIPELDEVPEEEEE